jgi:uncharacterized membrane protein
MPSSLADHVACKEPIAREVMLNFNERCVETGFVPSFYDVLLNSLVVGSIFAMTIAFVAAFLYLIRAEDNGSQLS